MSRNITILLSALLIAGALYYAPRPQPKIVVERQAAPAIKLAPRFVFPTVAPTPERRCVDGAPYTDGRPQNGSCAGGVWHE